MHSKLKTPSGNATMNPNHLIHSTLRICLALAGLLGVAASAHAASFTGTVLLPDGKPAFGAMVTVFDATKQKRETVYTDAQGQYSIRNAYEIGRASCRERV